MFYSRVRVEVNMVVKDTPHGVPASLFRMFFRCVFVVRD